MADNVRIFFGGEGSRQHHTQFLIDSLVKLGKDLRSQRNPAEHEALKNSPQTNLQHLANGMTGNLARLAYKDRSGLTWLTDWTGPSHRMKVQASAHTVAAGGEGVVLRPSEDKTSIVVEGRFQLTFKKLLGNGKRTHDSEYLLLNLLHYMSMNVAPINGGELVLVTELIPCEHCESLIRVFCSTHNHVDVSVAYMFETKDRRPKTLVQNALPTNLAFYKLAIHGTGASAVQITESTTMHALTDHVLEQGEDHDFSSHVLGHAVAEARFNSKDDVSEEQSRQTD
jgi:hypothetical protein